MVRMLNGLKGGTVNLHLVPWWNRLVVLSKFGSVCVPP